MNRKDYYQQRDKKIINDFIAGFDWNEIAQKYGITRDAVRQVLLKEEAYQPNPKRCKKITSDIETEIVSLRQQGKKYDEIAEAVGYETISTVMRVCQKVGLGGTAPWRDKRNAEYRKYWELGYKVKDIAEMFGVSEYIVRAAGCGTKKEVADVPADKIIELRHQGLSYGKIAAALGVTKDVIRYRCEKLGCGYLKREPQEPLAIRKACQLDGFEYLGEYTGCDGWLKLRCKKCGCVFDASCVTIRKDEGINCPGCKAAQSEHIERLEAIKREANALLVLVDKMLKGLSDDCSEALHPFEDYAGVHYCRNCNRLTDQIYCSDKCKKTYQNRTHDQQRRAKTKGALVDKDIELMALYNRDNGVCHICGELCDLEDYKLTEDGYFVAGEGYPSIDHIIPLSKGGKHSWENVKLAHRHCNTIKRDRTYPLGQII